MTDDELVERMFAIYHTPGKTAKDVLKLARHEIERELLHDMKEWAIAKNGERAQGFFAFFDEYVDQRKNLSGTEV